jgi:hypothetical protein
VSEDAKRIIDRMESSSPGSSAMAPLKKVPMGDRYIWVPGGKDALLDQKREWTVWEANVLRSQMINPADITDEAMKVGLYRRTWKAHNTDLTNPDTIHEFVNNITFAMLSPNMNLTRNEIAQTRMKVRALVDVNDAGETHLLQRGDTVFGLADQHDDIVGIIKAAGVTPTTNEIGFARSTRIGNYVPMGEVEDFLGKGATTSDAAERMVAASAAAKDYLEGGGHRATHNLRMSPITQMVADRLEKVLSDPNFRGDWREAAASMDWLVPKSEKSIRGAIKQPPTWSPAPLTGKEDWIAAYDALKAAPATALRGPKGGFKTPSKDVIKTTMADESIPLGARTRWAEEIEYDRMQREFYGPGNAGANASLTREGMLNLLRGVREDIKTSEGRLEELLGKQADDTLTEAEEAELEGLATSANGKSIDALKTIFKNLHTVDDDVAIKPWRYTPGGIASDTMEGAAVNKPYAYIKNPDVVWRNMATNRALGSIMQMMKDVAEDPAFYRIRPGEAPSQFAERILNVTDGLAMKTGYFATDLSGVEAFDRGIMDRQMVGAVTIDTWDRTHTAAGKFKSAAAEKEWNDFRASLGTKGGDVVDKWIASGRKRKAGEFSWTDAMPAKIGVLKGNPELIASLKAGDPVALRAWVNSQIEKSVKSGTLSREDADRFLTTFTEDGDLRRVIGRNVTIYGGDYKVYDQALGRMKDRQMAKGAEHAWLNEVGNGAYQWYLWDEYRNIFDPELTVLRQSHTLDRVSTRALAISDDIHGAAGYLDKGGLPRVAGDAKARNIPGEGGFGYNYMDPIESMLAHAAGGGKVRGATLEMADGKRIIAISELKDRTTILHEMVHALFEPDLSPSMRQVVLDDYRQNVSERIAANAAARTQATADHITSVAALQRASADAEAALLTAKQARASVTESSRMIDTAERAVQRARDAFTAKETEHRLIGKTAEADRARTLAAKMAPSARERAIASIDSRIARASEALVNADGALKKAEADLADLQTKHGMFVERAGNAEIEASRLKAIARQAEADEVTAADMLAKSRAKADPADTLAWNADVSEHFVKQFQTWLATGKAPNSKMREAFAYFRRVLLAAADFLKANPDAKVSNEMQALFDDLFKVQDSLPDSRPFDATQEMFHQAAVTSSRVAEEAAHTFVYFRNRRSWLERSLNHQYFAYYPASYMWGKVLPEMVRFLAYEPFGIPAPLGGLMVAQRAWNSIELQKDSDSNFRDRLDQSKEMLRLVGILLPATPYEVPVNRPLWERRVAAWGNEVTDPNATGTPPSLDVGRIGQDMIDYGFGLSNSISTVRNAIGQTQGAVDEMVQGLTDTPDVAGPTVPMRMPVR